MKASVLTKLEILKERYEEIQALLSESKIISDQGRYCAFAKEHAQLESIVRCFESYQQVQDDLLEAQELLNDNYPSMREMADEEIKLARYTLKSLEDKLQILLLPKDPNDERNIFLEIRAGAGGNEAAIFAGDLFRMYSRYSENRRWGIEIVSNNEGDHGGFKELIAKVSGDGVYGIMKFESGGHRVQRVPETDSQGRVHTSTCTVAVMPELPEAEAISINPVDLRVDKFRASGAGGQHINKTDSAVRITHVPTGMVVECQDERSQHKNRAKAISVLSVRLQAAENEKRRTEETKLRRSLVASGERSERIRTYNYQQGRVSDHRINLTSYRLNEIMEGNLSMLLDPIMQEHQADQLAALAENDE